jgi:hypothetical protein
MNFSLKQLLHVPLGKSLKKLGNKWKTFFVEYFMKLELFKDCVLLSEKVELGFELRNNSLKI